MASVLFVFRGHVHEPNALTGPHLDLLRRILPFYLWLVPHGQRNGRDDRHQQDDSRYFKRPQVVSKQMFADLGGIGIGLAIAWIGLGGWSLRFEQWLEKSRVRGD